jgi:hypothetical protein
MKIDLEALAYILGTRCVVREEHSGDGSTYYHCELLHTEIRVGANGGILTPASSSNNRRWRTKRSARQSCARNIRGRVIRVRIDVVALGLLFQNFKVPTTLTA